MRQAAAAVGSLIGMLCGLALVAQVPAKPPPVKPPWQRLLQGEDARKAQELEKALDGCLQRATEAGDLEKALQAGDELARLRSAAQGADHWQAVSARQMADALRHGLRQGKEVRQEYAASFALQRQAEPLVAKGRYREAQPLLEKVVAVYRQALGEDYAATAEEYVWLADTLENLGRYREAEELFRRAVGIFRRTLGEDHPQTATGCNNLAAYLGANGRATEAEVHNRKALAVRRAVLGAEHPETAKSYNNLAFCLQMQGRLTEAEEGYRRALAIRRAVLGEDHTETAVGYNNLAGTLLWQGCYPQAEEGFRKALDVWRKALGENHPYTATSYNNLASVLHAQGQYARAEEGYRRALQIRSRVLGADHPVTAVSYNNVAANLVAQGKYDQAEEFFRKALDVKRKTLGEQHPSTAATWSNHADSLHKQGRYPQAEELCRKVLAIRRAALGEEHPDTAVSYENLAAVLYLQGKYADAEAQWQHAADSFAKARLRIAASGLGRATKTGERSPLPALAAVLARSGKPEEAWQRYEESLGRGTWDDLSARLRRPAAEQAKQAELAARLDRLDALLERARATKEETPEQKRRREDLLGQRRRAQDELSAFGRHLEEAYSVAAGQIFERVQIQAALDPDAALVGWLDLPGSRHAADPNGEHWAVLLRSAGKPVWVRLSGTGPRGAWTDEATWLAAELRAALQEPRGDWKPLARRLREQRLGPLTQHLAAGDGLPGVRRLIVLPSAALAGMPVETFAEGATVSYTLSGTLHAHLRRQPRPTTQGLLVVADPVFDVPAEADKPLPLPSGGVLLTAVSPSSAAAEAGLKPNDVLLRYGDTDLAGPADLKPLPESDRPGERVGLTVWRDGQTRQVRVRPGKLGVVLAGIPAPQAIAQQRKLDRLLSSATRGGKEWEPLPGTRFEAEALRRLFPAAPAPRLLLDSQASEQQLYELARNGDLAHYRYLHLATHGEVEDRFPLRSAILLARDHLPEAARQLEAGLPVFDGRLTAEEVLRHWHLDSELVTLSACQRALGKYERGEGFVGFAQALILAGSRSVCLSLWKVDDTATALLMERFYQNLLGRRQGLDKPLSRAAALAEAKDWLRRLPREEALRQTAQLSQGVTRAKGRPTLPAAPELPAGDKGARPFAHPYYWATFVLIGDPD
jgi:tetratricopeptide (TPR) repeat protein